MALNIPNYPNRFENRFEASRLLVPLLAEFKGVQDALVVAIPRGGLEIGGFIAQQLGLRLEVALVKKLPAPGSHELAIGAVAIDGGLLVDEKAATEFGATREYLEGMRKKLALELADKNRAYRTIVPELPVADKRIILVDDGMATGYTVRAAVELLKRQGARSIIVAVPVTSASAEKLVSAVADRVVASKHDPLLYAVGSHYNNFEPVTDQRVLEVLRANRESTPSKIQ
ncbi:MAG: phosphoribosyltransferase family protein [Parcubacteria group bacterium]